MTRTHHPASAHSSPILLLLLLLLPALFLLLPTAAAASSPSSPSLLSISAVTLLLPPPILSLTSTFSVNHSLHAYGGCFSFILSDPSLITLTADHSTSCTAHGQPGHTSVHLTPTLATASPLPNSSPSSSSPLPTYRRTVWVSVTPLPLSSSPSSPSLHCEVFIDRLHRLSLLTSTRRISLGDTETVLIQGYDESSNVFSSLEGLPFTWVTSHPSTLSLLPLSTAHVNASARLQQLEAQGITSHLLAVQGKTSGKSTVTATLQQPKGEQPVQAEVELVVLEPLLLLPRHARVCPGSAFDLQAYTRVRVDGGGDGGGGGGQGLTVRRPITLPSPLYHFTSSSSAVVSVSPTTGRITALSLGSSSVSMLDNNVEEHREALEVDVINPHRLTAELVVSGVGEDEIEARGEGLGRTEADDGWWIRQGSTYRLVVRMKDEHGRAMDFAPNTRVRVQVDGASVAAHPSSLSSLHAPSTSSFTLVDLQAKMLGQSSLTLTLDPVTDAVADVSYTPHSPLVHPILITVTPALSILPSTVFLPASPSPLPHSITLNGGSGRYSLTSSTPTVASTISSPSSLTPLTPGLSTIIAVDARDPDNRAELALEVGEVGRVAVRGGVREAMKGDALDLVLEVGDVHDRAFDDCAGLTLHLDQTGEAFHGHHTATNTPCITPCDSSHAKAKGCWRVPLRAVKAERSGMTAQVSGLSSTSTSFMLSAFNPAAFAEEEYVSGVGCGVLLGLKDGPISPPKETAQLHVSVHALRGGKEEWRQVEPSIRRVYLTGEERVALPSTLLPVTAVTVRPQPAQGKGGMREAAITCGADSAGDYLLVADVSHALSATLPKPMHNRAFTWITCVPALALSPSTLSLGRGEKEQVRAVIASTSTPHPLASLLLFSSSNPSVAHVSSDGSIQATALGRTVIRAHLPRSYVDPSTPDTLTADASLEVKFDSFIIVTPTSALVEGRAVLAHVEGKNGEVPGDDAFEGVAVEWTTDSDGLSLLPPLSYSASTPHTPFSRSAVVLGLSVLLVGRRAGNHSVQAQVRVAASAVFAEPSTVNYSITVEVVRPLSLCGPASFLLPFSGVARLPPFSQVGGTLDHRLLPADPSSTLPALVTLSRDATTVTARRPLSPSDAGDDAVLVVSSATAGEVQVTSITVSVRPLRQLTVSSIPLKRWLCVGEVHEVEVIAADGLGRWFDGEDGVGGEVEVRLSNRALLKAEVQRGGGKEAGRLGVVKLTALQHAQRGAAYSSVVVRLSLKGSVVAPIYLQLFVSLSPSSSCPSSPSAAQISFHYPLSYSTFPLKTAKRRDLTHRLHADLATALHVPLSTLRVVEVNPASQTVKAVLAPQGVSEARWHPHQWFLREGEQGVGGGVEGVVELARRLQAQVRDEKSLWRRKGSTGREVDAQRGVDVTAVPFDVDDSASPEAEQGSVWTDERDVDRWERTHDLPCTPSPSSSTSTASSSSPASPSSFPSSSPLLNSSTSSSTDADPYEAIALRIHESFQVSPASSSVQSAVAFVVTTAAMAVGGAYLVYWWMWRGKRMAPSFGLWLREALEWLVRGAPPLVVPVQGSAVGRSFRQETQALVG